MYKPAKFTRKPPLKCHACCCVFDCYIFILLFHLFYTWFQWRGLLRGTVNPVSWGVHSQGVIVNMPIPLYREKSKLLTCEEQGSIVLVWAIINYNENKPCLTCSVFKQDRMSLSVFSHKEVRVVISVFIDSCLDTWRKKKHAYSTDTAHHITVCVIWQGGWPLIQTELIWCGLME